MRHVRFAPSRKAEPRGPGGRGSRQRGYAGLLALLMMASVATTGALYAYSRTDTVQVANDRATREALAAAKAALISYAAYGSGPTGRPGELPCPDQDGDGLAEAAPCPTLLGQLPWKTLGIERPVDSSGASLWYALSNAFQPMPMGAAVSPSQRLNSDTRGTIRVLAARVPVPEGGTTPLTQEAVAVLFAPGAALGTQTRGNSPLPAQYLDEAVETNNALSAAGPFITAPSSDTFNDQLVYLEAPELMPLVEIRVAHEMKRLLTLYRVYSPCQCFPWSSGWPYAAGLSLAGQNRGRFPISASPEAWTSIPLSAADQSVLSWIEVNDWHNMVWYTLSQKASAGTCVTCSANPTLIIGEYKAAVVLITPGTHPQPRLQQTLANDIASYFDDPENRDGVSSSCPADSAGASTCDEYVRPQSTRRDRDRVQMLGAVTAATCASQGTLLEEQERCGSGSSVTNPICLVAIPALDSCGCAEAARTIQRTPCVNNRNNNNQVCVQARTQLRACS